MLVKYKKDKNVFYGMRIGSLVRIGTESWAASFEVSKNYTEEELRLMLETIVNNELTVEEAARLLGGQVVDYTYDAPVLHDDGVKRIEYRWDVIRYWKSSIPLYQRRGEERIIEPNHY